ncbi:hypothetical protein [Nibricoccus sp. IMCC34717]|uniref:hypothetical protein n=1 Tax=Nibricoccus sp. IMCC34717 TaxID=3034021 RepID=UPI0038504BFE
MNHLRTLLEDNAGGLSSIRLTMLAAYGLTGAVWVFVAVSNRTLPDIPPGVVTVLGLVTGAKAAQRFGEKGASE